MDIFPILSLGEALVRAQVKMSVCPSVMKPFNPLKASFGHSRVLYGTQGYFMVLYDTQGYWNAFNGNQGDSMVLKCIQLY